MVNRPRRSRKKSKRVKQSVDVENLLFTWTGRLLGFTVSFIALLLLLAGILPSDGIANYFIVIFYIFAAVRVGMLVNGYINSTESEIGLREAVELGSLLVVGFYLAIYQTGGQPSMLMPAIFLVMAFLITFNSKRSSFIILLIALGFEWLIPLFRGTLHNTWHIAAVDSLYMVLFAFLPRLILHLDVRVQNVKQDVAVREIMEGIRKSADEFRWGGGSRAGSVAEKDRIHDVATYFEIHHSLRRQMEALSISLYGHTCALLTISPDHEKLRVLEVVTESDNIETGWFDAQKGFLAGVVSHKSEARAIARQWNRNMIGYYVKQEPLFSCCALPILEDDTLKAILCMDRIEEYEFSDQDMKVLQLACEQIAQTIATENLLRNLDRDKNRYFNLSEASKQLSLTHNTEEVEAVALEWTHRIAPFDVGALVMISDDEYEVKASWPPEVGLTGLRFGGGSCLVDWVITNEQPLSHPDLVRLPRPPVIFTKEEVLKNVGSLLILPLTVKDEIQGAFVFISTEANFFVEETKEVYQIFLNQLATSLINAEMVTMLEKLAVTDPLTGLHNRRFFMERLVEQLARAERHGKPAAIILCDIDHFKNVNDTYGHPVGDEVIKRVAKNLKESTRKIDICARYGGEEFIMLLDASDPDGALAKAEELRERISDEEFDTEKGKFRITMSFGISMFPADSRSKDQIVELSDQALYHSKENGRNRVTLFHSIKK